MGKRKRSFADVLEDWSERDLTAAARAGELAPAFCIDDLLTQLGDILVAGRAPILVGESGVGKSALIHELLRRLHTPSEAVAEAPAARPRLSEELQARFADRRVLQISMQRRASSLRNPRAQMGEEMLKLVDALCASEEPLVPFFRDIHRAYQFDLEPHFETLGLKFDGPILAEGEASVVQSLLEYHPELDQHFVTLTVPEPDLERMRDVLAQWSEHHAGRAGKPFSPEALSHALYLSHRFLSRSRMPRKAIDLVEQVAATAGRGSEVEVADVLARFCQSHRVPRELVDPGVPLDLDQVRGYFDSRVLGQSDSVRAVIDVIGLIKAGLSDARRPFAVFLFVGPTGVGKTHLAQLLAEFLFGSRERIIRINMADYAEPGKAEVLFGDPNANGAQMRGVLTLRVSGQPFAVLLLDEFEKAHASVHDRLFQLMDEGAFINGAGESVSCRSMIIIATSNAGSEVYRANFFGFAPNTVDIAEKEKELDRRLREIFRFEFLNRFDRIVHFHPLAREHIRTIAVRELELIGTRAGLTQRNLALDVDEVLIDWVTVQGYHPDFGARFLRRTIERHVVTALAAAIVREGPPAGAHITVTVRAGRVVAFVSHDPAAAAAKRQEVELPVGTVAHTVNLDEAGLRARAAEILDRATPLLAALTSKQEQRTGLLARMNEPGFWDDQVRRGQVVEQFRSLDVAIRSEQRLAEPLELLGEALTGEETGTPLRKRLAEALERAAHALNEWETRLAEEGPSALWLALGNADPLRPGNTWVEDLTRLELAWCERLGLDAQIVGYALTDGHLARVFIDVEGPGAAAFLTMEEGIHRMHRGVQAPQRVLCELIEKRPLPSIGDDTQALRVHAARSQQGLFGLNVEAQGRVRVPERGLVVDVLGSRQRGLEHLLVDLAAAWSAPVVENPELARVYAEGGTGARDPRTGVVAPRLKHVLAGQLDRFLEGWRRHRQPNAA
ncbi:AAA family ATPase [Haliangium sp.]|uniref:AAA family ATPase n=1 Tax=Haliangium sp. TaxID=2663208 RepID=UPI003D0B6773